jgi:CTP:molybdopterin cytidylyltransferase MocA
MIASLQKSGVAMIVVVTGPEDKKLEKQLAQFGVFFVQNHTPEQEQLSVQLGVNFLADKCDRYFLMHADRPLRLRKPADGKGKCPPGCQRTIRIRRQRKSGEAVLYLF